MYKHLLIVQKLFLYFEGWVTNMAKTNSAWRFEQKYNIKNIISFSWIDGCC